MILNCGEVRIGRYRLVATVDEQTGKPRSLELWDGPQWKASVETAIEGGWIDSDPEGSGYDQEFFTALWSALESEAAPCG